MNYNHLQLREVFHLEFLRWLGHRLKVENYVLKGGTNLRFFYGSFRYSEDIDLDSCRIKVNDLQDVVMEILSSQTLQKGLQTYGIARIVPPDITKAKQTETTQRFKMHLITYAGEDLFTKIEFSRRGISGGISVHGVSDNVLRVYKMPPLVVPHYDIESTVLQKIYAVSSRSIIQARDIFDLYILSSQYRKGGEARLIKKERLNMAYERIFEVSFEQFRDTVISYLLHEDQSMYNTISSWDNVRFKVANFIDELRQQYA